MPRARRSPRCERPLPDGFTLVEVLVTLVIMAMVAAIAFGALRQVVDTRARLRPYLDQAQEVALATGWFRQTVQALIPDYDETGPHKFAGSAAVISGLTASPLIGPAGTPLPFEWALEYDPANDVTVLDYREGSATPIRVAHWAARVGQFSFYAGDQNWHSAWPPTDADQSQEFPQLPQLVRLGGMALDAFPTVIAAPRGSPVPRPLPPAFLSEN
ncbi:MAG: prepilin-type N-terminal cleavage/methylation domain-containing protein [Alphaproteobacteria bacterium]|nr:prepilin-type N-terminal cleavage/methylation domain-containing protein [Alphaproteobacteria bacterium]